MRIFLVMKIKSIEGVEVSDKKVLLRCGFDVPFDKEGNISDDKRIQESLKTIKYLIKKDAKIIIISHNGRPKGKVVKKLGMKKVVDKLKELLPDEKIKFVSDCIGETVEKRVSTLKNGEVLVLENLRFYNDETDNSDDFSKKLASYADIYVNDAFAVSHREQSSITGIPKYLPSYAGFLIEKEVEALNKTTDDVKRPYAVIIGGAKSDKILVIKNLLKKVDKVIIGGILANTFLKASGVDIGASKYDEESIRSASALLRNNPDKIMLPIDAMCANSFEDSEDAKVFDIDSIPNDKMIFDIGPQTMQLYSMYLLGCETIAWGGPIGVFEVPEFAVGTKKIAQVLANSTAQTIICGGDSAAAVKELGFPDDMSHVSTGGGASLEYLQGTKLPGIKVLQAKK